jgi:Ribosomal RNA adenine dimethylase
VPFARKRFGQHFLHDASVVARILEAVDARPGEAVVEIGPGRGVLTQRLLEAAGALDAIEIDRDLAGGLQLALGARPGFTLHVADALEVDFAALAARRGRRLRVVGNLPYNISTPLMFHLLRTPAAPASTCGSSASMPRPRRSPIAAGSCGSRRCRSPRPRSPAGWTSPMPPTSSRRSTRRCARWSRAASTRWSPRRCRRA